MIKIKKITHILFLLLCFCSISAFTQNFSYDTNTLYPQYMTTDTFDIQFFNEHKKHILGSPSYHYYQEDGTYIELSGSEKSGRYQKLVKPNNSSFSIKKAYYLSGELLASSSWFFRSRYGKAYEYDKKGNVTRIIDWTETFKLKVEDLIFLIKEEYGIDLSIAYEYLEVDVCQSDNPFYRITIPVEEARFKRLIIDATTGKLIYETDINRELVNPIDPKSDNYWKWTPKLKLKERLKW